MGAFYSTLDNNNNIKNVYYKGINEKDEKYSKISKKYLDFLKRYGFYTVELDLKEFDKFVEKNKEVIESFKSDQNELIESFKKNNVIESFINIKKKNANDIDKRNAEIAMMLFLGSNSGIYLLNDKMTKKMENDGKNKVGKISIIISKMFLRRNFMDIIDFIFYDIIDINNKKNSEGKKRDLRLSKKLFAEVIKEINYKRYPKIVFSNIIGVLIKVSLIMTILKNSKGASKNEKHKIFKMIAIEIINIIPDDRCYIKDKKMNFLKFDPELCQNSYLSISEQELNKCNYKLNKANKLAIWKYVGIGFIILSFILFIMYLVKKPVRYIKPKD